MAAGRGGRLICGMLAALLVLGGCAGTDRKIDSSAIALVQEEEPPPPVARQDLPAMSVDRIVVIKQERRMRLMRQGKVLREYEVALGREPVGHKQREGDRRTPEGVYRIDTRNSKSAFYRSLRISYPSVQDRLRAAKRGVSPGGAIMIHGLPNGRGAVGRKHLNDDWTDGCIAVTNEEMDEIWQAVPVGVPIEIRA